jgi:hypothetical protein
MLLGRIANPRYRFWEYRRTLLKSIEVGQVALEFEHWNATMTVPSFGGILIPSTPVEYVGKVFSSPQEAFNWYKSSYEKVFKKPYVATSRPGLPDDDSITTKLWYRLSNWDRYICKRWYDQAYLGLSVVEQSNTLLFREVYCPMPKGAYMHISGGPGFTPGKYQIVDYDFKRGKPFKAMLDRPVGSIGSENGTGYSETWATMYHISDLADHVPVSTSTGSTRSPIKPVPPLLRTH